MKQFLRAMYLSSAVGVTLWLTACSSEPTCDYSKMAYQSATSVPALQAPEGLSAPDRSASLVIPPPPPGANAAPLGKGKCLDRPPSYFATNAKGDTSAEKKSSDK